MGRPGPSASLRPALGLANRPIVRRGLAGERAAGVVAGRLEDRPAVTLAELARGEQVEHLVGKVEEPDQVRDRRAASAEPPRELLLAQPQILDQGRAGARLVHGVQVLPGHVLDQRRLQALGLALVANDRRHRLQAGLPRRPPAALAGDQLVATVAKRAHDQRLDHAGVGERRRQRLDRVGPELRPGLARVAPDQLDGQLPKLRLRDLGLRQDRRQPAAHSRLSHEPPPSPRPPARRRSTDTRSARSRSASSSASSRYATAPREAGACAITGRP